MIIASMRARKKSSVCMLESPRNLLLTQRFSGESVDRVYTKIEDSCGLRANCRADY